MAGSISKFQAQPNLSTRKIIRFLLLLIAPLLVIVVLLRNAKPPSLQLPTSNLVDAPPFTGLPTRPGWTLSSAPKFCRTLVAKPEPAGRKCTPGRDTQKCEDGKVHMMSQYGQDYYLYTRHFSHLKRRGIYVDIATNNATKISNSYFMDACLGWDGICVEANPLYFDEIKNYRSCRLIDTCVGDTEGENVTFILARGFGGITDTNRNVNTWLKDRRSSEMELTCKRMDGVLEDSHVSVIDYLSLDVEGHELKVLHGFDWDRIRINVMTVEGTDSGHEKISEFLSPKGYVRHIPTLNDRSIAMRTLGEDAIFLHKSVKFGAPR